MNVKHGSNKIRELTDMLEQENVLYFHSTEAGAVVD